MYNNPLFTTDQNIKMCIYKITNIISGKIYIGQTRGNVRKRWLSHIRKTKKNNTSLIYLSLAKHGIENFSFEVVDLAETIDQLNYKEQLYIKINNSLSPTGYNLTSGGLNYIRSEETNKKHSDLNIGRIMTASTKEKQRKSQLERWKNTTAEDNSVRIEKLKASHAKRKTLGLSRKPPVITPEAKAIRLERYKNARALSRANKQPKPADWIPKKYNISEESRAKKSAAVKAGHARRILLGIKPKSMSAEIAENRRIKLCSPRKSYNTTPEAVAKRVEAFRITMELKRLNNTPSKKRFVSPEAKERKRLRNIENRKIKKLNNLGVDN